MSCRVVPPILAVSAACLLAALAPAVAEVDSVFRDFKPSGELLFELDGETVESAQLFLSDRAGAYLVMGPDLGSPLLIQPRTGTVEKVSLLKVQKAEDGTIDLLADASFDQVDRFKIDGQQLAFQYKGQRAVLKPKPPLLGKQSSSALRSHKPEYGSEADSYQPKAAALTSLAGQSREVTVRVFLGTWCPVCGRLVPKMMKLDEELQTRSGSKIRFEYYGLPRTISDDPVAEQMDVHSVPTAVVLAGGRVIGRLDGRALNSPETALQQLLGS